MATDDIKIVYWKHFNNIHCLFKYFQREIRQQLAEKAKAGELKVVNGAAASQPPSKRKRRWDQTADQTPGATPKKLSSWDQAEVISFYFLLLFKFFFLVWSVLVHSHWHHNKVSQIWWRKQQTFIFSISRCSKSKIRVPTKMEILNNLCAFTHLIKNFSTLSNI